LATCHLHLGSNIGDRKVMLASAIQKIEEIIGPIVASSSFYETEAWGNTDQADFINIAIEVEHYTSPTKLLEMVNRIEDDLGRVRKTHWGPRAIDIDILLMGDLVTDTKKLTIPHRYMQDRNFVLYPLAEIAGEMMHPVFNKTINELLSECDDDSDIKKLEYF